MKVPNEKLRAYRISLSYREADKDGTYKYRQSRSVIVIAESLTIAISRAMTICIRNEYSFIEVHSANHIGEHIIESKD